MTHRNMTPGEMAVWAAAWERYYNDGDGTAEACEYAHKAVTHMREAPHYEEGDQPIDPDAADMLRQMRGDPR